MCFLQVLYVYGCTAQVTLRGIYNNYLYKTCVPHQHQRRPKTIKMFPPFDFSCVCLYIGT
jgi:hypothetical protein